MAKTVKKTAKKTAAPKSATVALDPATKIVVNKSVDAPEFREGSAVAKRVAAVMGAGGKTVELALKRGARTSTVRYLAKAKVIRLVTSK
jgi:hypothetical protein